MFTLAHIPGAAADEQPIILLRRHWLSNLSLLFVLVLILVLPPAISIGLPYFAPNVTASPVYMTLLVLGGSIFFLFAILFIYQTYIDYYLDTWIITNKRILSMEQRGLFSRTVSELRLYRVQDVTAEVKGFWRTMLDYGNVYIQTAGEQEHFVFEEVSRPNAIAKTILDLSEKERKENLEEVVEEFGMPANKK